GCDARQQGQQQGVPRRHVAALGAVRLLLDETEKRPDRLFAVGLPWQREYARTLDHGQQLAGQDARHRFQRSLRGGDHRTVAILAIGEGMYGPARQQYQARGLERHAAVFQRHLAHTAADIENLEQRIVLVGLDLTLVQFAALVDPLQMQHVLPCRPRTLTIQRVVGDVFHRISEVRARHERAGGNLSDLSDWLFDLSRRLDVKCNDLCAAVPPR